MMDTNVNITRRHALKVLPAIATVAAVPAAALASAEPRMTPVERINTAVRELKAALLDADPDIRVSFEFLKMDSREHAPFMLLTSWVTGGYEGDGIYRDSRYDSLRYRVKLLSHPVDGQRGFSVIPIGEKDRSKWMTLNEDSFETFIGKKVSRSRVAA